MLVVLAVTAWRRQAALPTLGLPIRLLRLRLRSKAVGSDLDLSPIPEAAIDPQDVPGLTARPVADQTQRSIDFYASERVPASLIAGSAIASMFAYPLEPGDSALVALAKHAYMTLATLSFCNSLVAVFAASAAIVRLSGSRFEPLAKDPVSLLYRETPVFFLAVRAHFLTGVLCFAGALSIKMFAAFGDGTPAFSRAMLCMVLSSLLFMVSLYNQTLVHFRDFGALWWAYIRVLVSRMLTKSSVTGKRGGIFAISSFALAVYSIAETLRILLYYALRSRTG